MLSLNDEVQSSLIVDSFRVLGHWRIHLKAGSHGFVLEEQPGITCSIPTSFD